MSEMQERLKAIFPIHEQIGKALIINCDCNELMKHIRDNEAELSCVDPPYGIGMGGGKVGNSKVDYKQFAGNDNAIPDKEYFVEIMRVSKNQIIWGANYMTQHTYPTSGFLIWDKVQPQDFTMAMCEFAWMSFNTPAKIYKQRIVGADLERIHPTQKPVKLYEWILTNYAKPNDKILDTHGGSMSSVIAALNLGYEIVCSELDVDYYNAGVARVLQSQKQQRMFE